jgi:hypothetical protein
MLYGLIMYMYIGPLHTITTAVRFVESARFPKTPLKNLMSSSSRRKTHRGPVNFNPWLAGSLLSSLILKIAIVIFWGFVLPGGLLDGK